MIITERIESFREASRHIWNVYFRHAAQRTQDWDLLDTLSDVHVALFNAMVCFDLAGKAPCIPQDGADGVPRRSHDVVSSTITDYE